MSNMKTMLENQQKINEAVKDVVHFFDTSDGYVTHLELMLNAQTQIIGLMQMAKKQLAADRDEELFCQSEEIFFFLTYVKEYLQMLKPFLEIFQESNEKL